MGNKLDLQSKIQYTTQNGYLINMTIKDLKGKTNFPNKPSDGRIKDQYKSWIQKVELNEAQQKLLEGLPYKYKFRLCFKHEQKMKEINEFERKKKQLQDETDNAITKIITEPNTFNLQALLKQLQDRETLDVKVERIIAKDFVSFLLAFLKNFEIESRTNKQFRNSILILRTFEVLLDHEDGKKAMQEAPEFFTVIFNLFHPIQPEITGLMMKIVSAKNGFCWYAVDCTKQIMDAMEGFREQHKLQNRFYIFIRTIFMSTNILMIYHVIYFLWNFLTSIRDPVQQQNIISEFKETTIITRNNTYKIEDIFKQIQLRIRNKIYTIDKCSFPSVMKSMDLFVHPLVAKQDNMLLSARIDPNKLKIDDVVMLEGETNINQNSPRHVPQTEILEGKYYFEAHELASFQQVKNSVDELVEAIEKINLILEEMTQFDQDINDIYPSELILESKRSLESDQMNQSDQMRKSSLISSTGSPHSNSFEMHIQEDELLELQEANKIIKSKYDESQKELDQLQIQIKDIQEHHNKVLDALDEEYRSRLSKQEHQINDLLLKQKQFIKDVKEYIDKETQVELIQHKIQHNVEIQTDSVPIPTTMTTSIVIHPPQQQINIRQVESQTKIVDEMSLSTTSITKSLPPPPPPPPMKTSSTTTSSQLLPPPPPPPIPQPKINVPAPPPPPPIQSKQAVNAPPPPPPLQKTGTNPPPPPPPMQKSGNAPPPPPLQKIGMPPPPPLNKMSANCIDTPRPPMPPPPMQGSCNIPSKGPLPPPPFAMNKSEAPQQTVHKQRKMPTTPMRTLNWVPVNQNNAKNSIFAEIDELAFEIDTSFLESNFNKVAVVTTEKAQSVVPQKINLLNPEKSKNIEIVLGKLKLPNSLLAKSLLQIDYTVLTPSILESLDAICPTEDETKTIIEYDGDRALLGNAEQFVDSIRVVNQFAVRIKAMKFQNAVMELLSDIKSKLKGLVNAFGLIRNLKSLKTLIQTTLAVGNFMNNGQKMAVIAFKIDYLEKLNDVKSTDKVNNMLTFVIESAEKQLKGPIITEDEILDMEIVQKLPISQISIDLAEVKKGSQMLKKAIDSQTSDPHDKVSDLKPIYESVLIDIEIIDKDIKVLEMEYASCATYYCENPKDSSERFGEKIIKLFRTILKNKQDKKQRDDKILKAEELKKKEELKKQQLAAKAQVQDTKPKQFALNPTQLQQVLKSKPIINREIENVRAARMSIFQQSKK